MIAQRHQNPKTSMFCVVLSSVRTYYKRVKLLQNEGLVLGIGHVDGAGAEEVADALLLEVVAKRHEVVLPSPLGGDAGGASPGDGGLVGGDGVDGTAEERACRTGYP